MAEALVHIIDDDTEIIESVEFMLESEGVGCSAHRNAEEFLTELDHLPKGCILLDLRLSGMQGLELMHELHERACVLPVVVMTGHGDVESAVAAMKEGAIDFLQKPFSKADLMVALTAACKKLKQMEGHAGHREQAEILIAALSQRERQVVEGLAQGKVNKIIGFDLGISPRTVEIHRANAMKKLNVKTLPELLHIAFYAGLMD